MGLTTAVLIALLIVYFFSKTGQGKPSRKPQSQASRKHSPYQSASIRPGPEACQTAKRLGAKRFLSSNVPQLPLASCSQDSCACRYQRHVDRRSEEDRRASFSMQADLYSVSGNAERRSGSLGRRSEDKDYAGSIDQIDYDKIKWTS